VILCSSPVRRQWRSTFITFSINQLWTPSRISVISSATELCYGSATNHTTPPPSYHDIAV
jgi:hypothetical protein